MVTVRQSFVAMSRWCADSDEWTGVSEGTEIDHSILKMLTNLVEPGALS
ncbi:hypothetical protein ATKI12_7048 [Kitasatospora sp. Ki12]